MLPSKVISRDILPRLSRAPGQFVQDLAALQMTSRGLREKLQGGPWMSVYSMLQPLVQVARELVASSAEDRIGRHTLSLGLFVPEQLDRLIEVAASKDNAQRPTAIWVLAGEGSAWLRPEQREAFVAPLLRPLNNGTWTHTEWDAVRQLAQGDMPLLNKQLRQVLCDALSGALAKSVADRDDSRRKVLIRLRPLFLKHMNESQQEALVQAAISAGIPGNLAAGLQDLSRELRTTLFNEALAQHRRAQEPAELDALISGFAHLTVDQRTFLFEEVLAGRLPDDNKKLAAQWEHLSPDQHDRLLHWALDLAGRAKGMKNVGAALEHMEPWQQEAVVTAASSLPGWDRIYAIQSMTAAGMASLEESLRNRLVDAVHEAMADGNSSFMTYRGARALLPALACLDPGRQAVLVTAGLSLPDGEGRSGMVASLLAASMRLGEDDQARLLPGIADAAAKMVLGGAANTTSGKKVCLGLADAFGHLDAARRTDLLAAAGQVRDWDWRLDQERQPQPGAITVLARNLPALAPPQQEELVAAAVRFLRSGDWHRDDKPDVLVALAVGVEKLQAGLTPPPQPS